ncbi:hypothetical protein [Nocardia asiatica]
MHALAQCATQSPTPEPYKGIGGRTRYSFSCVTCDVFCSGSTEDEARAAFEAHRSIPAPAPAGFDVPLTAAIVSEYPEFYISGPGRQIASATDCGHGYWLTDSCPCCP